MGAEVHIVYRRSEEELPARVEEVHHAKEEGIVFDLLTNPTEILVDEKNSEIARLYAQLKAKDEQLSNMDDQLRVKDVQIAEKDKQIDQQQQLTLTAMKDKEELKLELDEAKVEVDEAKAQVEEIQTKQEEASKKGFFGRLFGK
ncbi:DUF536 domain-containing protein [uncultured Streptococcus sp.]|uniref:DUF536 domain-containing protein n=1 Tax=uncultured Streptococcus sp. TaxID=83427 RepID=UPI0025971EEA|nr:DUF536 domain-containing protein [uncultured Streptococcus sp.]